VQMNPKWITIHTCDSSNPTADEDYWIEDILLFIEGKIDVYGNFCIKLDLERGYRFWTFLGMNFLHPQIIENKLQFHFEAAKTQTCASITWWYN
jgi:hypothetical protein